MTPSPTQSNVMAQLRAFLLVVLPPNTKVVAGQLNRVAEPANSNFVVMTPIRFERVETNVDGFTDAVFTGSISGDQMTISAVNPKFSGQLAIGSQVFGVGVADNTVITALGTGTGGAGTYTVNNAQTIPGGTTLSAGTQQITQHAMVTVQLDFHSADLSIAGDMAQTVSTLFRDGYAVDQFAGQIPNYGVVPLLAEDPKMMPFINEAQQYEWRWVLEAMLQANQVVSVPQQFADAASVQVIDVDATYAP